MSLPWPRRSRPLWLNVLCGVVALAIVGTLVAALLFLANGGRWFVVATPSMGTAAPVGTLVLSRPTTVADLHVGDIISFHPPTAPSQTYTHRVAAISAAGGITTRGDINGSADGWMLHQADLIGKASWIAPGLGWLVRGLPLLVLGFAVVILITRFVRSLQWRAALRIIGGALVVSLAAIILRPFTGIVLLQTSMDQHRAVARVVSTGLLPIRVQAKDGTDVNLLTGQTGIVSIPTYLKHNYYQLDSALHLDFWGWVLFFLVCCIPLIVVLIVGLPPKEISPRDDRRPEPQHDPLFIEKRLTQRQLVDSERFA
jgi:signal peptidase I